MPVLVDGDSSYHVLDEQLPVDLLDRAAFASRPSHHQGVGSKNVSVLIDDCWTKPKFTLRTLIEVVVRQWTC